ncbi:MAG: hypothetical protein Tp1124DCM108671_6 [Prokaryotic dsDNA virus sp.]|nr:MAG: hypothetical protein Tp1125DCM102451_26 [Prokaryotic dsDNA virus sp.]QDP65563.1 MAG: hypothetical protein Tp1124DCM108671_6 [Prokaryotic dsDNA virus sp.]|tara:strand:- start:20659 stop:21186 length:528 start_codon:yes stop_codon:yes gene_type:complete
MKIKISKLKPNTDNPRVIKEPKFKKLVQSIKDFPEMLELRPIVVDEEMVILGGNMRFRACTEAGLQEVPIKIAKGLTEEQKQEFIIKDNVGFGEWEWDILANQWDEVVLKQWGMDVWQPEDINLDEFFEDREESIQDIYNTIVLKYNEETYKKIQDKIKLDGRDAETIFITSLDI